MILFGLAFASELALSNAMVVGAEAQLQLEISDGRPRLAVLNTGETPIVVDWSRSWITPFGGAQSELVPGGAARPDANVLVAPVEIAPHERITVQPVPRAWLVDGADNDAEQWASWGQSGEVTIELVLIGDQGEGTIKATWKQGGAAAEPPLAIPADPDETAPPPAPTSPAPSPVAPDGTRPPMPVTPTPLPDPALFQQRLEWDRRNDSYRRQERTARVLWITGGTMGLLSAAFAGLTAAQIPTAADDPIDPEEPSRADLIQSSRVYGFLAGAGILVAAPTIVWDFSVRKQRKKMGPRP